MPTVREPYEEACCPHHQTTSSLQRYHADPTPTTSLYILRKIVCANITPAFGLKQKDSVRGGRVVEIVKAAGEKTTKGMTRGHQYAKGHPGTYLISMTSALVEPCMALDRHRPRRQSSNMQGTWAVHINICLACVNM